MECIIEHPAKVYTRVTRKARKAHRCCECHGVIKPGERYEHARGIWEWGAESYKTCADCVYLWGESTQECGNGYRIHLGLEDHLYWHDDAPRLMAAFKASRHARREETPAHDHDNQ